MFLIYILICLIHSSTRFTQTSPIQNSINENVLFDLTSETIKVNLNGVTHTIEAFKPLQNEQILKSIKKNETTNYSNLVWYSYGLPAILSSDNQSPFYFNSKSNGGSFYIQIETLTKQHRTLIINELETKYNIELNDNQVKNLIPSKFECKLEIECDQFYYLDGHVTNTLDFPLKVNFFNVSKMSKEMKCLQDIVRESEDDFNFECFLSSFYSQNNNNNSYASLIGRSFTFNKNSIKSITSAETCLKQFDLLNQRLKLLEQQVEKLLEDAKQKIKADLETNYEPIVPNPIDLESEVNQPYDGYH